MYRLELCFLVYIACVSGASLPGGLLPALDGRIVGGRDTTIQDHPHQISMRYYGSHRCGGSIINDQTILTAAHCVQGLSASSLEIVAGTSSKYGQGQNVRVKRIHIHERYSSYDYDLAVLKLNSKLQLSDSVKPIKLAQKGSDPAVGDIAEVTGWGAIAEGASSPTQLQVVEVPVVDRTKCAKAYRRINNVTKNMVCAGITAGGKDSCQGDSGGPMTINKTLVGVVSWGYGCARRGYPGVYSNVGAMREWVDQFI